MKVSQKNRNKTWDIFAEMKSSKAAPKKAPQLQPSQCTKLASHVLKRCLLTVLWDISATGDTFWEHYFLPFSQNPWPVAHNFVEPEAKHQSVTWLLQWIAMEKHSAKNPCPCDNPYWAASRQELDGHLWVVATLDLHPWLGAKQLQEGCGQKGKPGLWTQIDR